VLEVSAPTVTAGEVPAGQRLPWAVAARSAYVVTVSATVMVGEFAAKAVAGGLMHSVIREHAVLAARVAVAAVNTTFAAAWPMLAVSAVKVVVPQPDFVRVTSPVAWPPLRTNDGILRVTLSVCAIGTLVAKPYVKEPVPPPYVLDMVMTDAVSWVPATAGDTGTSWPGADPTAVETAVEGDTAAAIVAEP